jgi:glycosyltransferase involved in cell wall biosynthesis
MRSTISCIVPVYNGARYVGEAIESILGQTLPPTEIIVVDDGSTDTTADVVKAFAAQVNYVRQDNAGPASARNRGIGLASGRFLAFLDADDLWHKDKLARQMAALESNPAAGICICYVQNFWVEELAHERERMRDHDFAKPMPGYVCQCLLARRSAFETIGRFDESKRVGEDVDWYMRAEQAGIAKTLVADSLVYRRIHDQNISYEVFHSPKARSDMLDLVISNLRNQRNRPPK